MSQFNETPKLDLRAAIEAAKRQQRPTILIGTDQMRVNNEAITALGRRKKLYQRGGSLVRVVRQGNDLPYLRRAEGAPRIQLVGYATLSEHLADAAEWRKQNSKGITIPADPPPWSIGAVLERGVWRKMRHLSGIVEAPTLRPDGTVLCTKGYDKATGLLYELNADYPAIPAMPSRREAREAAATLLDLVSEFEFMGMAHKAAWLAALLTVLARPAISGPCPLFLFEATAAGTGKTLLAEVIGLVFGGREPPVSELSDSNEEVRKALTSILVEGERLVLLDNASGVFGCPALDAVLTATWWKGRILGQTKRTTELPADTVWFASGNNLELRGDTHRRVVPCRLEATVDRPEERTGPKEGTTWKYPDLKGHVAANRPALVAAALTILRAYFAAGCPQAPLRAFGSYEGWSRTVRQAVHWTTGIDPCDTRSVIASETRGNESTTSILLDGLARIPGGDKAPGLSAQQILDAVRVVVPAVPNQTSQQPALLPLREVIAGWAKKGEGLPSSVALGSRLRAFRGCVSGGNRLRNEKDPHTKANGWWCEKVTAPTEPGDLAEAARLDPGAG